MVSIVIGGGAPAMILLLLYALHDAVVVSEIGLAVEIECKTGTIDCQCASWRYGLLRETAE
jgi:hypothetical protein